MSWYIPAIQDLFPHLEKNKTKHSQLLITHFQSAQQNRWIEEASVDPSGCRAHTAECQESKAPFGQKSSKTCMFGHFQGSEISSLGTARRRSCGRRCQDLLIASTWTVAPVPMLHGAQRERGAEPTAPFRGTGGFDDSREPACGRARPAPSREGCAEQLCSRSQLRARPHRGLRRLAAPLLQDITLSQGSGGFTQNHPLPPLSPEPHSHESLRGGSARERVSVPRAGEQPGSPGGKKSWPFAVGKTAPARVLCPQHRQLGAATRTRGNRQVFTETLCWMQRRGGERLQR